MDGTLRARGVPVADDAAAAPGGRTPGAGGTPLLVVLCAAVAVLAVLTAVLLGQVRSLRGAVDRITVTSPEVVTVPGEPEPLDDRGLCRLLGAIAKRQGIAVSEVFADDRVAGSCELAAVQGQQGG